MHYYYYAHYQHMLFGVDVVFYLNQWLSIGSRLLWEAISHTIQLNKGTDLFFNKGGKFFSIYGGVFFSKARILLDFFHNFCNNREKDATFTFPSIYLEKILPPFYFILVGFECVTRFLITKEELTHIEINTPRLWLFRHRDYLQF